MKRTEAVKWFSERKKVSSRLIHGSYPPIVFDENGNPIMSVLDSPEAQASLDSQTPLMAVVDEDSSAKTVVARPPPGFQPGVEDQDHAEEVIAVEATPGLAQKTKT
jgi:hypothetical protein